MPPKKPFGADAHRDRRTDRQRRDDRVRATSQADSLHARAGDRAQRRQIVETIRGRRRGVADAVQVERLPRADGHDLVVASGRLLIRAETFDGTARDTLRRRGIVESARTGTVVLLTVPAGAVPQQGIGALAAELTGDGIPVSVDHVAPLGIWMKGLGGPARTEAGAPRPAPQPAPHPLPGIAVIDSGISDGGRTDGYLGAGISPADEDPLDVFPQPGKLDGDAGHGSMVTGIVQQIVPGAPVGSYRVADSDGIATTFGVAQQMRRAVADGATILNLSLGTDTADDTPPPALADVVAELADSGVLIVCAAGNGADGAKVWPAAFAESSPHVVAVGALDAAGEPAPWSTSGPWVTCSTVGQGVVSTYVVGTEDGPLIGDPNPDTFVGPNPWAVWTGTSFAAPQIAAAVARVCGDTGLSPVKALERLSTLATAEVPGSGHGWTVEILPGT